VVVSEPIVVYPEAEFGKAVVSLVKTVLEAESRRFALLERFGLDVAVVVEDPSKGNKVRLFEIKAFNRQRMGGVGFGDKRGGPQVDLLLCDNDTLCLFDSIVRWAYVDATQMHGASRYGLFTCDMAKKAAMGMVARGKQNNLRVAALRPGLVGWVEFVSRVKDFLAA
jgi:hypothetical protein